MKNRWIYVGTVLTSIGLILFSFIPYGWKVWENILVSIGCSGIAAAIMAIFLELNDEKKVKNRREQLRQTFLAGLDDELRHLFERVLWFDNILDKIDLSKEIEYYLSINFISEAHSAGYYRQTSLDECESEIKQICKKYELEALRGRDSETRSKIQKMFFIIGSASMSIITELDIIKRNQMFLITNDIFSIEELNEIYVCTENHVELLRTPDTNYGGALEFLLSAYKKTHEMGHFNQNIMIISWQNCKNLIRLLIEERRSKSSNIVVEQKEKSKKHKKKKR